MSDRLEILKDIMPRIDKYREAGEYPRYGLTDLLVYNFLQVQYKDDTEINKSYIWTDTVDNVMEYIISSGYTFVLGEGGFTQLWFDIRKIMVNAGLNILVDGDTNV